MNKRQVKVKSNNLQKETVNKNLNYIDILIGKSVSGNATSEEIEKLESWKNISENNLSLFTRSLKIWQGSEKIISKNQFHQDKIKLESAYSRYLAGKIRNIRRLSFIYKIAAILAFPIAFAIVWHFMGVTGEPEMLPDQICQITSPKGHVSKCILPDGTNVWINTESTIKYNASSFNNLREIHLEGEAYFEVISDPEKPFKVETIFAEVNVTGTAFNVLAYPSDDVFETVLAEGSVNLKFKSGTGNYLHMRPGQRAILNLNDFTIDLQYVDAEMFTSWRNGELIFKDDRLYDLLKELEKMHNVRFHLKDENIGEFRFRGMFSYNNNLIESLEKIKKTSGIDYYIKNKEVWLKKNDIDYQVD